MKKIFGNNWKTTVGGILGGTGVMLASFGPTPTLQSAGAILTTAAVVFFGFNAKDVNVTGGNVVNTSVKNLIDPTKPNP